MPSLKSDHKKNKGVEHWIQLYLQAKASGDKRLMDLYAKIILKVGGKVSRF